MSESVSPPPPSEEFSRSPSPPAKKEPTEEAVLYLSLDQKHSTDQDIVDLLSPYGTVNATYIRKSVAFVSFTGDVDTVLATYNKAKDSTLFIEKARKSWDSIQREKTRDSNIVPTDALFVTGFDPHTREQELRSLFSKYGHLEHVTRRQNNCFIGFKYIEDARVAREETDGYQLHGRTLIVEFSPHGQTSKPPKPPPGSSSYHSSPSRDRPDRRDRRDRDGYSSNTNSGDLPDPHSGDYRNPPPLMSQGQPGVPPGYFTAIHGQGGYFIPYPATGTFYPGGEKDSPSSSHSRHSDRSKDRGSGSSYHNPPPGGIYPYGYSPLYPMPPSSSRSPSASSRPHRHHRHHHMHSSSSSRSPSQSRRPSSPSLSYRSSRLRSSSRSPPPSSHSHGDHESRHRHHRSRSSSDSSYRTHSPTRRHSSSRRRGRSHKPRMSMDALPPYAPPGLLSLPPGDSAAGLLPMPPRPGGSTFELADPSLPHPSNRPPPILDLPNPQTLPPPSQPPYRGRFSHHSASPGPPNVRSTSRSKARPTSPPPSRSPSTSLSSPPRSPSPPYSVSPPP